VGRGRIVEQLAQSPPHPVTDHPDYEVGLTFLADQRGPLNRLHESRVQLAHTYLDCLASGSPTGPIGRWERYLPAHPSVFELLDAAVAGLQIPDAAALRWGLDLTPAPLEMSR
jgi:hypothetical protein